jgi:hypothetical protein
VAYCPRLDAGAGLFGRRRTADARRIVVAHHALRNAVQKRAVVSELLRRVGARGEFQIERAEMRAPIFASAAAQHAVHAAEFDDVAKFGEIERRRGTRLRHALAHRAIEIAGDRGLATVGEIAERTHKCVVGRREDLHFGLSVRRCLREHR